MAVVAPAPLKVTSPVAKSETDSLKTTVKLMGDVDVGSLCPLAWTIVHPIDDESPLRHWTASDLKDCDAEFLVLLNGFEETFSQNVHTRSSYKIAEIVWGARFQSMFNPPDEHGEISVDIRKLHDFERIAV